MSDPLFIGFTGAFEDPLTRGYPLGNGYRWYLPTLMRFNAADELSPFDGGGPNSYVYCSDDPVNHRDPTGHIRQGVLTRPLSRGAGELDATAREPAQDAPIAVVHTSRRGLPAYEMGPPPPYGEAESRSEPPPPYMPTDPHSLFAPELPQRRPLPSARPVRVPPVYHLIDRGLSELREDMGEEMLRIHGGPRPGEPRLPGVGSLITAFFSSGSDWRQLRARRAAELERRAENVRGYRSRLRYLKQRINEDPGLALQPALKAELRARLKRNKRLLKLF
ncbi:RHS repeat-associated core domain-containing protein [Trinickia dabaoshanensis]|nr:RHS repeat-associated core domain-containing protein [Trinickia dabaoshanensis]